MTLSEIHKGVTIVDIHKAVTPHKPCTQRTIRRYIKAAGIQSLGVRQHPQIYPEDSPKRVLEYLGLADHTNENGRIVSIRKLQSVRKEARRGK